MRNLGNRITLHSPSRGFSMELGSAITVILATRLSLFHCYFLLKSSDISRAAYLNNSVYLRRDRRCWTLFWYLENDQLAYGCMDLLWLVHHLAGCRYHFWVSDGDHHQRSEMGIPELRCAGHSSGSLSITRLSHVEGVSCRPCDCVTRIFRPVSFHNRLSAPFFCLLLIIQCFMMKFESQFVSRFP